MHDLPARPVFRVHCLTPGPFLLVAVTGRALAASAARAGHPVVVLDCFGDRDTAAMARAVATVCRSTAWRFDQRRLLRTAGALAPPARSAGLVYGSGFEDCPDLLGRLAAGRTLFGNAPSVVALVKEPSRLFPLFHQLGIAAPEVRYARPDPLEGWLVKRAGGAGGTHVRWASRRTAGPGAYWQRFEAGRVCSVLFLADGRRASVVGFNEQWPGRSRPTRPFLYGGAVSGLALPPPIAGDIAARLDGLVAATGLRGLNGLDFLWQGERWLALEVNPRPTATLELHDADFPAGLFDAHLTACRGELTAPAPGLRPARAHAIFLVPTPWEVPSGFAFPPWCRDLPGAGTVVREGDPLCTVHAEGATPAAAMELLGARVRALGTQLETGVVARV